MDSRSAVARTDQTTSLSIGTFAAEPLLGVQFDPHQRRVSLRRSLDERKCGTESPQARRRPGASPKSVGLLLWRFPSGTPSHRIYSTTQIGRASCRERV